MRIERTYMKGVRFLWKTVRRKNPTAQATAFRLGPPDCLGRWPGGPPRKGKVR